MKRLAYLSLLFCVLGIIMLTIASLLSIPKQETITLEPTADTSVMKEHPDSNTGLSEELISAYSQTPELNITSAPFLMFNLSTIPSGVISSAKLSLYVTNVTFWGGGTFRIRVCYCTSNEWTELDLTYNKMLDFVSAINEEGTDTVDVLTSLRWYTWNVKSDVEQARDVGRLTEVFLIQGSYGVAFIASRESANPPKLVIEVTLPQPSVLWVVFPSGITLIGIGALCYLRYRKQTYIEKIKTGELVEYIDRRGSKLIGTAEQVRRWKEQEEHEKELERLQAGEKHVVVKEIVKVRCQYCGQLFDSTLDKCPYCGGKR